MLDLRRFPPRPPAVGATWRHDVRRLDRAARLALPELAERGPEWSVVARLRERWWELAIGQTGPPTGSELARDDRSRVLVPLGVRRSLGLGGLVIVSISADASTVAVWPTAALDRLLEVPA